MQISKYRDLTILNLDNNKELTIACDSCGGIGESELDLVKAPFNIVGYFSARVCLFETISYLANPMVIVNNFCVEMEHRGRAILEGINQCVHEYNESGFQGKILGESITGSTEENFKTLTTALGLTVLGERDRETHRGKIDKGDIVISVGLPKVGQEVIDDINEKNNEIVSFKSLSVLVNQINSKDLLPVGSKGILYEINEIEKIHNVEFGLYKDITVDINRSSGPATTLLAVINKHDITKVKELIKEPINVLGEVI